MIFLKTNQIKCIIYPGPGTGFLLLTGNLTDDVGLK